MAAPETPNSRKETYYDSILKDGDTGLTPNSREEMYLDAIDRDLDDIRAEVAKKSESIRLEYKNNKIYKDGVEIDFEGIKALMGDHDNDIDLHADNSTIMRITAFADDAIEFSTTYITGGKVYVDRVIINSDNDIKFDELEAGGGGGDGETIVDINSTSDIPDEWYYGSSSSRGVAIWKMPEGIYRFGIGVSFWYSNNHSGTVSKGTLFVITKFGTGSSVQTNYTEFEDYYISAGRVRDYNGQPSFQKAELYSTRNLTVNTIINMVNSATDDQKASFRAALGL